MSRYIDADMLINGFISKLDDEETLFNEVARRFIVLLRRIPSIDIVRCKECKKHNTHRCHMAFDLVATNDDDFCSYGERKESE